MGMCHVFVMSDKLSVVCVSDHEYPPRVAHTMMQRVGEDFAGQIDSSQWKGGAEVGVFSGQCEVYLNKFQDPTKSDAMSRLQTDPDDTKIILHNTIEAVLQRGEKLMIWLIRVKRSPCSRRHSTKQRGRPTVAVGQAGDNLNQTHAVNADIFK